MGQPACGIGRTMSVTAAILVAEETTMSDRQWHRHVSPIFFLLLWSSLALMIGLVAFYALLAVHVIAG
jgi:hypothetical protein